MKYILMLNDMRQPNVENIQTIMVSADRQEVVDFYNKHLAKEYWSDDKWGKVFKKGSPLEWFNPSSDITKDNPHFGGIYTTNDNNSDENILRLTRTKSQGWRVN